MVNSITFLRSPLGLLRIEGGAKGVVSVGFAETSKNNKSGDDRLLKKCVSQINRYFRGSRARFTVKMDLKGTPFQKKVWSELAKIPQGKVVSYRRLAERLDHPRAARAVGNAAGANPVCILVPCHRLVASKGWGGYAYGLARKKKLLKLENCRLLRSFR